MIIIFSFFYYSCNKSEEFLNSTIINTAIKKSAARWSEERDIEWLTDFQEYLKDVYEASLTPTNIYSDEDAVYGIESLLNYRYSDREKGTMIFAEITNFKIDTASNWLDLYTTARANILQDSTTHATSSDIHVYAFDIQIDTIIGDSIHLSSKTIFCDNSTCVVNNYTITGDDCTDDAFEEDEEYFLWLGGTEFYDLFDINALDCTDTCGDYVPCQSISGYAMEEIQHHINLNYPDPVCTSPLVWSGTYSDVQKEYAEIYWYDDFLQIVA